MNYSQGHLKKSTTLTSPESKKILMITLVLVRTPTARQNRPFSGQTFVVQQFMHVKWLVERTIRAYMQPVNSLKTLLYSLCWHIWGPGET